MTSDIWTKHNLWENVLGEIVKGFFATVEIYRRPVWNIYSYFCQNFIRIPFFVFHNGGYGIRMSWVKNILKINKRGGGDVLGGKFS